MWRYHLTSTPMRAALTTGLVFGVVMGAPLAVQLGPVQGAMGFVLGGGIFGLLAGLSSRHILAPLAGLSSADRATVMCTVQRGLSTADRRLAAAVIGYVEAGRRRQPAWLAKDGGARLFYLAAAFQLLQAVFRAFEGNWAGAALYVVVGVISLLLPRFNIRSAERRDQAERSARALLDAP
jgi:hypothetical protein